LSAFYESQGPRHYARFAFCKTEAVLDAAVERLGAHFASARAQPLTAAG
jgi:aspartate/methionine/tyrosine aminotransferase